MHEKGKLRAHGDCSTAQLFNCSTHLPAGQPPGRTFSDIRLPGAGEALGEEWLPAWAAVGRIFMPRIGFFWGHNGPKFAFFGHEIPFFARIIQCMLEGKPRYWVRKRVFDGENGLGRTVVLHSVAIIAERTGGNTLLRRGLVWPGMTNRGRPRGWRVDSMPGCSAVRCPHGGRK
jgi:hypothetical protein